jgi:hypothetical protein
MTGLIPGAALIYERVDGTVYARYRDPPHNKIPRWVIGGIADSVAQAQGYLGYNQWKELFQLADNNPTLRKQLDKTLEIYYLIKNGK